MKIKMIHFFQYIALVKSDLFRYTGNLSFTACLGALVKSVGFKYTFCMRTCNYLKGNRFLIPLYIISRMLQRRYTYRYGIDVPYNTKIDSGFYINHFGGIIVNHNVIIGKNCNVMPGVMIGQSNRGKTKGFPIIGDNVFIGPGAKIIGGIKIGNNVAIGANSVVTIDIPDTGVVVGVPGRVISYKGSAGYINRTDY